MTDQMIFSFLKKILDFRRRLHGSSRLFFGILLLAGISAIGCFLRDPVIMDGNSSGPIAAVPGEGRISPKDIAIHFEGDADAVREQEADYRELVAGELNRSGTCVTAIVFPDRHFLAVKWVHTGNGNIESGSEPHDAGDWNANAYTIVQPVDATGVSFETRRKK